MSAPSMIASRPAEHTPNHAACPACAATLHALQGAHNLAALPFPQAARLWLGTCTRIGASTRGHYEHYIRSLDGFFGGLPVCQIHAGHLREYQQARQAQIRSTKQHAARKRGAPPEPSDGASRINHEISCVLRQVLTLAGRWKEIGPHYEPLPLPTDEAGIALSAEEERHLFTVARSRPRWRVAYCCDLLSRNTTAGPGEIRHLRLQDIDFRHGALHIREGAKNPFRVRPLPTNDDARWAIEELMARYMEAVTRAGLEPNPEHYLLYHRANSRGARPDFFRPMGSWKKAHYAMRREAGKKFPRLLRLRRYDFRHTACTMMLENPSVSYSTIEHLMGHHLGSNTKRKYDHLRNASLRAATEALNASHAQRCAPDDGESAA